MQLRGLAEAGVWSKLCEPTASNVMHAFWRSFPCIPSCRCDRRGVPVVVCTACLESNESSQMWRKRRRSQGSLSHTSLTKTIFRHRNLRTSPTSCTCQTWWRGAASAGCSWKASCTPASATSSCCLQGSAAAFSLGMVPPPPPLFPVHTYTIHFCIISVCFLIASLPGTILSPPPSVTVALLVAFHWRGNTEHPSLQLPHTDAKQLQGGIGKPALSTHPCTAVKMTLIFIFPDSSSHVDSYTCHITGFDSLSCFKWEEEIALPLTSHSHLHVSDTYDCKTA